MQCNMQGGLTTNITFKCPSHGMFIVATEQTSIHHSGTKYSVEVRWLATQSDEVRLLVGLANYSVTSSLNSLYSDLQMLMQGKFQL